MSHIVYVNLKSGGKVRDSVLEITKVQKVVKNHASEVQVEFWNSNIQESDKPHK
jgi:hypothetical protein